VLGYCVGVDEVGFDVGTSVGFGVVGSIVGMLEGSDDVGASVGLGVGAPLG